MPVLLEHVRNSVPMAHATLNERGQGSHAGGHDGVANHDWERAVLRGTHSPELEAVATEGERCGSIAVLCGGFHRHCSRAACGLHLLLSLVAQDVPTRNDAIHVRFEELSRVQGDDGRRRFLGAEAMVVAGMGHGAANELVVLAEAVGKAREGSHVELGMLLRLAWVEEVETRVRANRPVGMLPVAVDAREGLLVEERHESHPGRLAVHDLHEEDIVVCRRVGHTVNGGHLVLCWGDLVVLHGNRAAHLHHLGLNCVHELIDFLRYWGKVVQVHLLIARRQLAHERAAAVHKIRSSLVEICRHHEELLLPAQVRVHVLGARGKSDCFEHTQALSSHGIHGSQEWRLLVDALAEVRHEGTGDAQHAVHDHWRGRPVPGGEGCSRVRHTESAVREGRSVRLALEETLVRQDAEEWLVRHLGAEIQVDHGVHLEGTHSTSHCAAAPADGEEPVRKVSGSQAPGPLEHGLCDHRPVGLPCWLPSHQALLEALVHILWQPLGRSGIIPDGRG
mmetsp:Transcript_60357/g.97711  ORF Transcript_60357/g.97711 Transcript_60357/m.97711 type:complete len:507 (-) Transcript_60357:128-1648(-)